MIRVLWEKHEENFVTFDTIRDSIEKSRDRLRVLADMVLTASGLLLSSCFAFLVLLLEKLSATPAAIFLRISFTVSALLFLFSAVFSIASALLRPQYTIVTELKFIDDLMRLFEKEVRLFTIAFVLLLLGLIGIFLSLVAAAIALPPIPAPAVTPTVVPLPTTTVTLTSTATLLPAPPAMLNPTCTPVPMATQALTPTIAPTTRSGLSTSTSIPHPTQPTSTKTPP